MSPIAQRSVNRFTRQYRRYVSSHQALTEWFRTQLPEQIGVPDALIYGKPTKWPHYDPQRVWTNCVVLSLTPTEGVYEHLVPWARHEKKKILFLHRPWGLDVKRIIRTTLVLQSHVRFDELYTTGYNVPFALQHGVDLSSVKCLQGYKDDPERKIGLLGKLGGNDNAKLFAQSVIEDFQGCDLQQGIEGEDQKVLAIASLNAFTEETVQRVQDGFPDIPMENVLCITGAAREAGLEAAKKRGMQVICVGHRRCEMWGLRYLARKLSDDLGIDTIIVDEPDVVLASYYKPSRREVENSAKIDAENRSGVSNI